MSEDEEQWIDFEEVRPTDTSPSQRKVTSGVNAYLEEWADNALADYRRKYVRRHRDRQDFLSIHQLKKRIQREVYVKAGVPDENIYSGIFKRVYSAETGVQSARAKRMREVPWISNDG